MSDPVQVFHSRQKADAVRASRDGLKAWSQSNMEKFCSFIEHLTYLNLNLAKRSKYIDGYSWCILGR